MNKFKGIKVNIFEKGIWTQDDFEIMQWHDCPMYGVRFEDEVLIDLDYILKWELNEGKSGYSFWISPATLVFHDPSDLKIVLDINFVNGAEIYSLERKKDNCNTTWSLETQQGCISLKALKFTQYLRKQPIFVNNQYLTREERGGYSFEKQ